MNPGLFPDRRLPRVEKHSLAAAITAPARRPLRSCGDGALSDMHRHDSMTGLFCFVRRASRVTHPDGLS